MSKWINKYTIKITSPWSCRLCAMNGPHWENLPGVLVGGQDFFEKLTFKLHSAWWESTCKNGKWSRGQSILGKKNQDVPSPDAEARIWHGHGT